MGARGGRRRSAYRWVRVGRPSAMWVDPNISRRCTWRKCFFRARPEINYPEICRLLRGALPCQKD